MGQPQLGDVEGLGLNHSSYKYFQKPQIEPWKIPENPIP